VDKSWQASSPEPGVPRLSFGEVANGREVTVSQSRFFLNPKNENANRACETHVLYGWPVLQDRRRSANGASCPPAEATLKVPMGPLFLSDSACSALTGSAYYAQDYRHCWSHVTTLMPVASLNISG